jgi:hypothetical protein
MIFNHLSTKTQTSQLILYSKNFIGFSEIHTKYINILWTECRIFLPLRLVVHTLTARLYKVKRVGLGPSWANVSQKKGAEQRIVTYYCNRSANTPDRNQH